MIAVPKYSLPQFYLFKVDLLPEVELQKITGTDNGQQLLLSILKKVVISA